MRHSVNLDLLRAFAVIAVLLSHLMSTLQVHAGLAGTVYFRYFADLGYAGVLAFFVHTSLVLMYSLARMEQTTRHVTARFYLRRLFRIYPLSVVCVALVVLCHIPPFSFEDGPIRHSRSVIAANLLLVQNLWTRESVLGPLWSLPYEVQMYLVLPALYWVARKRRSPLYLSGLFALFCGAGALLLHRTGHANLAGYVPCFVAGVLCYTLRNRLRAVVPGGVWLVLVPALLAGYCVLKAGQKHGGPLDWLFCLVLALLINVFHDLRVSAVGWLANRVALYSYGVYLLHIPVLYLVFVHWHLASVTMGVALFAVLTGVASMVSFYAVEAPMIEVGRRLSSARPGQPFTTDTVQPAP